MTELCGKRFVERIQEYGRRNGFCMNEREQQYLQVKSQPKMRNMQMEVWERK